MLREDAMGRQTSVLRSVSPGGPPTRRLRRLVVITHFEEGIGLVKMCKRVAEGETVVQWQIYARAAKQRRAGLKPSQGRLFCHLTAIHVAKCQTVIVASTFFGSCQRWSVLTSQLSLLNAYHTLKV